MYRYHAYRRCTQPTGHIPITTLRRWNRLKRLLPERMNTSNNSHNSGSECAYSDLGGVNDDEDILHGSSEEDRCSFLSITSWLGSFNNNDSESDNESLWSMDALTMEDENESDNSIFKQKLYFNSDCTVADTIFALLDIYVKDALKKKTLYNLLDVLDYVLPKPNNLPKNKYFLMKLINSLIPDANKIINRYRMCEDCGEYLGAWNVQITRCSNCNSTNINGLFVEYNLHSALKDAFECRNLKNLMDDFDKHCNAEEEFITDITTGTKYKYFKQKIINQKFDVCLLWNTDGLPIAQSSNGQVWLIQAQVINIPPQHRRNYQYVCGIYYSNVKKPNMTTFLYPFVRRLQNLFEEGIYWSDGTNRYHSKVIAPIATIDAPARATVQNMMQYNGEYGCSFCEHKGETCQTGAGHNRVYCPISNCDEKLRTKESMYIYAQTAINEGLYHVRGVKGPSVTALIPCFDVAESFVPDYMHCDLLGIWRMLLDLWFNSKYKHLPFYIKKRDRDEIDRDLEEIYPPDYVTRMPRKIKHINYWKASELRESLLNYFPVLLNRRLNKKYYENYLILVYATRLILNHKIHNTSVELADCLFRLFVVQVKELYGLEKCSFNVHQATHMARYVEFWGPAYCWSTFPFEDGNGFIKRLVHGVNKIDIEISNTLKILNAYQILKFKLGANNQMNTDLSCQVMGKSHYNLLINDDELHVIEQFCDINNTDFINFEIFAKIKLCNNIITSKLYRQTKRENFYIHFRDAKFGYILYFLRQNQNIYALVRLLVEDTQFTKINIPSLKIDFSEYLIPFRETYCILIISVDDIKGKLMRVKNYLCVPANMYEKK